MPKHRDTTDGRPGKLSAEQALQLAAEVAELAKAGLPLGAGLRALADDLPGGSLSRVLREISDQLDRGVTLEAALEAQGPRLPTHVRGLVIAGVRSGRLAEVLEEFVDLQRSQTELRRRVWLGLAYPILLLVLLSGLLIFLQVAVVSEMVPIFEDFEAQLPPMTELFLGTSEPGVWIFAGLTLSLIAAVFLLTANHGVAWMSRLLHFLPLVGPLWRFGRLAQFSRLMAVLLEHQVSLPDALRLTATGLGDADLANGCRRAAGQVEAGRSLVQSIASQRQFPSGMIPLLHWGQNASAPADAFRAAAEMFEGRVHTQGILMETALLPITFLLIAAFVMLFLVAIYLPLISLIEALTY